mmetsp:Transcript_112310/g.217591  ORF Transcript_112310/g.217591 Transcript_112310/m.217591 type:complete len:406 (-) Transcript_112310:109-1326(-)|eukprot:CAMPEP_0172660628 /NCGR_PEP_ID=MMETSP1074-20121228/4170_1 /TAXON_ID=2916 /ORGANISM="Ceratium fusus, Strain PA161109" /LENGTH=405 /DNA_ID=CAMNT_0013476263 /DNA_START=42 /DNA_END=1259 /DNA_ORIENTATION=+
MWWKSGSSRSSADQARPPAPPTDTNEMATLAGGVDLPVAGSRFGIGLSWDAGHGSRVDLDLQAIAFDENGKLLDAVYYNNLKALGKGLVHSGDEQTGEKSGVDEAVWANLRALQAKSKLVLFVIAASRGHLCDAINGKFQLFQDSFANEVAQFPLENSDEEVDLVGALVHSERDEWFFRLIDLPAQDGQHFIDILEPTIGNFVRQMIPHAPRRIKAAFAMEKGAVVDLPKSADMRQIVAGLGWDTDDGDVDLDVSVVLLDQGGGHAETVFFGNLEAPGITHSGDNLTGEGDGDDETITFELDKVPSNIQQGIFVINIYTNGKSFAEVANPYCRVISKDGDEFCRYQLSEAGSEQGLVVARLFRDAGGGRWSFQAAGMPCRGRTWKDSMPTVVQFSQMAPHDLQPV